MLSAVDLSALLQEHGRGVEVGLSSLWWIESDGALIADRGGHLVATLQLVEWEEHEGERRICSIKEQQMPLVTAARRDVSVERARAWLTGWCRALGWAMSRAAPGAFEEAMPSDLVFDGVLSLKRPQTAEDFEAAFRVQSRLGKLTASSASLLSASDLSALLQEHGDVDTELTTLQWVLSPSGELAREADNNLWVTMRLSTWERCDGGGRQVTNIKEQSVMLIRSRHGGVSVERARAWLIGWCRALGWAMSAVPEVFEGLMPSDLVFDEVLSLKRPQTAEDFEAAHRARSRLGKLVPAGR